MGRRLLVAGTVLLLVAACGDDHAETATTTTSSTTSGDQSSDWCDELEGLELAEDFESVDIAGAPEEIREPLQLLADDFGFVPDPEAPATGLGPVIEANALLESWGHEHCGSDHPFCSMWLSLRYAVDTFALAGGEDPEDLESVIHELDDVLIAYAPSGVRDDLETTLAAVLAPEDADEPAAEAAYDALDEWTRSEGCSAAPAPDDEEE